MIASTFEKKKIKEKKTRTYKYGVFVPDFSLIFLLRNIIKYLYGVMTHNRLQNVLLIIFYLKKKNHFLNISSYTIMYFPKIKLLK